MNSAAVGLSVCVLPVCGKGEYFLYYMYNETTYRLITNN